MNGLHTKPAIRFGLALALIIQATALQAQQGSQGGASGNEQGTPAAKSGSKRVILPAPLGGFSPQLTTQAEDMAEQGNLVTGGIGLDGIYTDNSSTAGTKAVDDYQYVVMPRLGLQTFGRHTQWVLDYGGGFTLDQRLPMSFQQAHNGVADLRHAFTRRLTAELRQDFALTNSPFSQTEATQSLPTVTGPGQLSSFLLPFPITVISSISSANMTYQLSRHSAMGASGSFSMLHFADVQTVVGNSGNLIDTTNTAGRAFYLREVSSHQTIGTEYQLQNLGFEGGTARTVDQTLYVFDGFSLGNNSLTLYAGPERSHTHNIIVALPDRSPLVLPLLADEYSVAGGFAYMWRAKRSGFGLSGDRRVTDGGGWQGAARMNTASVQVEKALGRRWTATLQASYSDGRTIQLPPHLVDGRITTESGLAGLECRMSDTLTVIGQYARIQQPHLGAFTHLLQPDHNQVMVGFTYSFRKVISQ